MNEHLLTDEEREAEHQRTLRLVIETDRLK
jgi:hypothetical protein